MLPYYNAPWLDSTVRQWAEEHGSEQLVVWIEWYLHNVPIVMMRRVNDGMS